MVSFVRSLARLFRPAPSAEITAEIRAEVEALLEEEPILGRFRSGANGYVDENGARVDVELIVHEEDAGDDLVALAQFEATLPAPFVRLIAYGPVDESRFAIVRAETVDAFWLARRQPPGQGTAVRIGQLCLMASEILSDALQAAPSKLSARSIVDQIGVAPFGITLQRPLKRPGVQSGVPLHLLSPELVRGFPAVNASHQFGIASVVVELATGARAFDTESDFLTLETVRNAEPNPPLAGRDLSPGLVAVLERMLARRPEERFASAAEARDALEPFAADDALAAWIEQSLHAGKQRA